MTLEAIYFIGQTIAALAIVGSLIFVGNIEMLVTKQPADLTNKLGIL